MRKLPRWKRDCYIRNTTTGHVERRIHGDADFMVKHGWIFTTREAWDEYVRGTPKPIPERKLQSVLVPAVKSGFHAINGVLVGALNLDITGARKNSPLQEASLQIGKRNRKLRTSNTKRQSRFMPSNKNNGTVNVACG